MGQPEPGDRAGAEIVGMDVSGQFLGAAGTSWAPGSGADQARHRGRPGGHGDGGRKSREVPLMRLPGYGYSLTTWT
ncbi:hypothetical protein NKG94_52180 [Micromonospora sp. M12]